jgi:hypothetical protein
VINVEVRIGWIDCGCIGCARWWCIARFALWLLAVRGGELWGAARAARDFPVVRERSEGNITFAQWVGMLFISLLLAIVINNLGAAMTVAPGN